MSASKHTPGPWYAEMSPSLGTENVRILWDVHSHDRVGIARSQSQEHLGERGIHEQECRANAQLIAAAPDMLSALRSSRDVLARAIKAAAPDLFESDEDVNEHLTIKRMDAAIARAIGDAA